MAKRFRIRLSFRSFQFCRFKRPSSLPQTPLPVNYWFSPVNPKASDIAYPAIPEPPPSTPNHHLFRTHVSPAKAIPVNCGFQSKSCLQCKIESSPEHNREEQDKTRQILYNSPESDVWPVRLPKAEKEKKESKKNKKAGESVCKSTSSGYSGWFSSEDNEESESESLISSSISLDSSSNFSASMETVSERHSKEGRRRKKNLKTRRLKTRTTAPENVSPTRPLSVFRRLIPCAVDGKVKESFAVVKRSKDPYEDFKRSMLEMILEKQMFDVMDLEQLLQCFLSLNSRHHHEAIVRAFAEIWEVLFCRHGSVDH
ncbi:transcription repressor OFP7-like [Actinidia eriantha]|uniref:transcription repressor OFP7-like n=1 Tax=Actinidia eriantha TaxID=165200 RepID=UPI0025879AD7|nr:transcription repressor OFP7-like [Actinidia eriantha]